jgi:16S rRNA processing protein RimM
MHPHYLLIGEVLRPHGVKGEVRLRILTDYPERVSQLKTIYLGTDPNSPNATPYTVQHMRMNQEYGLLKLKEINDRNEADRLRELFVMVKLDQAVPLEEGEFYLYQLIGLAVQTVDGEMLGTISEVLETGANDVYIVNSPQHGEVLIPVTDETIVKTDIKAGIVMVNLPEGLLGNAETE